MDKIIAILFVLLLLLISLRISVNVACLCLLGYLVYTNIQTQYECDDDTENPKIFGNFNQPNEQKKNMSKMTQVKKNEIDIDGDETLAYQNMSRNDPVRAISGITKRRRFLDPYLREEVDESEDRFWWGQKEL